MQKIGIFIGSLVIVIGLAGCGGKTDPDHPTQWSKPEPVLEGCDGVMLNSKQCQDNPGNQQLMIKIDNK